METRRKKYAAIQAAVGRRVTRSTVKGISVSPTEERTESPKPRTRRGATPDISTTPLPTTPAKIRTRRASLADTPQEPVSSPLRRSRRLSTNSEEISTPSKIRNLRSARTNLPLLDQPVVEEEDEPKKSSTSSLKVTSRRSSIAKKDVSPTSSDASNDIPIKKTALRLKRVSLDKLSPTPSKDETKKTMENGTNASSSATPTSKRTNSPKSVKKDDIKKSPLTLKRVSLDKLSPTPSKDETKNTMENASSPTTPDSPKSVKKDDIKKTPLTLKRVSLDKLLPTPSQDETKNTIENGTNASSPATPTSKRTDSPKSAKKDDMNGAEQQREDDVFEEPKAVRASPRNRRSLSFKPVHTDNESPKAKVDAEQVEQSSKSVPSTPNKPNEDDTLSKSSEDVMIVNENKEESAHENDLNNSVNVNKSTSAIQVDVNEKLNTSDADCTSHSINKAGADTEEPMEVDVPEEEVEDNLAEDVDVFNTSKNRRGSLLNVSSKQNTSNSLNVSTISNKSARMNVSAVQLPANSDSENGENASEVNDLNNKKQTTDEATIDETVMDTLPKATDDTTNSQKDIEDQSETSLSKTEAAAKTSSDADAVSSELNRTQSPQANVAYAKSWSQSIRGLANKTPDKPDFIDAISVKQPELPEEPIKVKSPAAKKSTKSISTESDEEDDDGEEEQEEESEVNQFLDNEAMEASCDESMDSEERAYLEENEIPERGESIGSADTSEEENYDEDGEGEMDSFIVSDSEMDKLSGKDSICGSDDENSKKDKKKQKKYRRIVKDENSESEDEKDENSCVAINESASNDEAPEETVELVNSSDVGTSGRRESLVSNTRKSVGNESQSKRKSVGGSARKDFTSGENLNASGKVGLRTFNSSGFVDTNSADEFDNGESLSRIDSRMATIVDSDDSTNEVDVILTNKSLINRSQTEPKDKDSNSSRKRQSSLSKDSSKMNKSVKLDLSLADNANGSEQSDEVLPDVDQSETRKNEELSTLNTSVRDDFDEIVNMPRKSLDSLESLNGSCSSAKNAARTSMNGGSVLGNETETVDQPISTSRRGSLLNQSTTSLRSMNASIVSNKSVKDVSVGELRMNSDSAESSENEQIDQSDDDENIVEMSPLNTSKNRRGSILNESSKKLLSKSLNVSTKSNKSVKNDSDANSSGDESDAENNGILEKSVLNQSKNRRGSLQNISSKQNVSKSMNASILSRKSCKNESGSEASENENDTDEIVDLNSSKVRRGSLLNVSSKQNASKSLNASIASNKSQKKDMSAVQLTTNSDSESDESESGDENDIDENAVDASALNCSKNRRGSLLNISSKQSVPKRMSTSSISNKSSAKNAADSEDSQDSENETEDENVVVEMSALNASKNRRGSLLNISSKQNTSKSMNVSTISNKSARKNVSAVQLPANSDSGSAENTSEDENGTDEDITEASALNSSKARRGSLLNLSSKKMNVSTMSNKSATKNASVSPLQANSDSETSENESEDTNDDTEMPSTLNNNRRGSLLNTSSKRNTSQRLNASTISQKSAKKDTSAVRLFMNSNATESSETDESANENAVAENIAPFPPKRLSKDRRGSLLNESARKIITDYVKASVAGNTSAPNLLYNGDNSDSSSSENELENILNVPNRSQSILSKSLNKSAKLPDVTNISLQKNHSKKGSKDEFNISISSAKNTAATDLNVKLFSSLKKMNQSTPTTSSKIKIKVNDRTYMSSGDEDENAMNISKKGKNNVAANVSRKSIVDDTSFTIEPEEEDVPVQSTSVSARDKSAKGKLEFGNASSVGKNKATKKQKGDKKMEQPNSSCSSLENYGPGGAKKKDTKPSAGKKSKKNNVLESDVLKEVLLNKIHDAVKTGKIAKTKHVLPKEQTNIPSADQLVSAFAAYNMHTKLNAKQPAKDAAKQSAKKSKPKDQPPKPDSNTNITSKSSKKSKKINVSLESTSSSNSTSSKASLTDWQVTDIVAPKKKHLNVVANVPFGFQERPATPKKVNGFQVSATTPKSLGWKVRSVLSGGQKEAPSCTSKKTLSKKKKTVYKDDAAATPPTVWTGSGYFQVSDIDSAGHSRKQYRPESNGAATEFVVHPLGGSRKRKMADSIDSFSATALEFKRKAMFNDRTQRESSKDLLRKKIKKKF